MEAADSFTLPASRKAAKHKQHSNAAYTKKVEDIDINRSIHKSSDFGNAFWLRT
jgi:hypothetical protein